MMCQELPLILSHVTANSVQSDTKKEKRQKRRGKHGWGGRVVVVLVVGGVLKRGNKRNQPILCSTATV